MTSRWRWPHPARSGKNSIWTRDSPYTHFPRRHTKLHRPLNYAWVGSKEAPWWKNLDFVSCPSPRAGVPAPHLSGERTATTARLRRIRIHEDEALLQQGLLVVQDHAVQVNERLRIHEHAHISELKDAVTLAGLRVESDVIAQSRTAAPLHAQTKTAFGWRDAFLGHRRADLGDRLLAYLDALDGSSRCLRRDRLG